MKEMDISEYAFKNGYKNGYTDAVNKRKNKFYEEEAISEEEFINKNCKMCGSIACTRDKESISSCENYKGNIPGINKTKSPMDILKESKEWKSYLIYLIKWACDHMDTNNHGMTPISFDEYLDNEYNEANNKRHEDIKIYELPLLMTYIQNNNSWEHMYDAFEKNRLFPKYYNLDVDTRDGSIWRIEFRDLANIKNGGIKEAFRTENGYSLYDKVLEFLNSNNGDESE